jgi:hypothetical protein
VILIENDLPLYSLGGRGGDIEGIRAAMQQIFPIG